MKKQLFDQLVESIREAGNIRRGDRPPTRKFVFKLRNPEESTVPGKVDDFVDLAGRVSVSPEMKGTTWPAIKASTWRRRARARR